MIVTFGEIMIRFAPKEFYRFRQVLPGSVDVTFGGGEANVAAFLGINNIPVRYITALPKNVLAESIITQLRGLSVDTNCILRSDKGRVGLYFLETGANQRGSSVVYDRDYSSISMAGPEDYDFDKALDGATWLHVTGITPSLSEAAYKAQLAFVKKAKEKGVTVSCDLNFRKKLWKWRAGTAPKDLARECMPKILEYVDVVIGNEEDAEDVLNIHAEGTSVESGQINSAAYVSVATQICERFPNVSKVAITLRESISATHNNWGAMLYDKAAGKAFFAPLSFEGKYEPYEIRWIVDRVGGGDSFAGGLIYALTSKDYADSQSAISFAVAASCLKHSLKGDFNFTSAAEIAALMGGNASGRVQR